MSESSKLCKTCKYHRAYTCRAQRPGCAIKRPEALEGYGCPQHQEIKPCSAETVSTTDRRST